MNKSQAASDNFFLSPILQSQQDHSPYLSPFQNPFRKHSVGFEDLIDFRLEEHPEAEREDQREGEDEPERVLPEAKSYSDSHGEEPEEAASINHSQHCEMPSTKFAEVKEEHQPPFFLLRIDKDGDSPVQAMIEFLVEHSQLKEDMLELQSRSFCEGNPAAMAAFRVLAAKFRKLRKTKEEMTKYCMRKAFKFVADRSRKDRTHSRDLDNCMRQYFQGANGGNFSIPFKKHSTEKTMNGNFLKRIFSCTQFAEDYRLFLRDFHSLVAEDNDRKVKYLASMVEEALAKGESDAVAKIKRLPWTREILRQVHELAASLADSPQQTSTRQSRRSAE